MSRVLTPARLHWYDLEASFLNTSAANKATELQWLLSGLYTTAGGALRALVYLELRGERHSCLCCGQWFAFGARTIFFLSLSNLGLFATLQFCAHIYIPLADYLCLQWIVAVALKVLNPCCCQFRYAAATVQKDMEAVEQFLVLVQLLQYLCLANVASISHGALMSLEYVRWSRHLGSQGRPPCLCPERLILRFSCWFRGHLFFDTFPCHQCQHFA